MTSYRPSLAASAAPEQSERLGLLAAVMTHIDASNRQLHPEWEVQRYPFSRAIMLTCAQLLQRLHWKWWPEPAAATDRAAQHRDLVLLLEFALSWALRQGVTADRVLEAFDRGFAQPPRPTGPEWGDSLCYAVERIATAALNEGVLPTFAEAGRVCAFYDVDLPALCRRFATE